MLARGRLQGMPLQGGLAGERCQVKLLKRRQQTEQGVAGERELQQRKQKRWRWDMYELLERLKHQNNQNCHVLIKLVIFSLAKTWIDDRIRQDLYILFDFCDGAGGS